MGMVGEDGERREVGGGYWTQEVNERDRDREREEREEGRVRIK
jgi:hypothetical protein